VVSRGEAPLGGLELGRSLPLPVLDGVGGPHLSIRAAIIAGASRARHEPGRPGPIDPLRETIVRELDRMSRPLKGLAVASDRVVVEGVSLHPVAAGDPVHGAASRVRPSQLAIAAVNLTDDDPGESAVLEPDCCGLAGSRRYGPLLLSSTSGLPASLLA
jgi:hypothetical protein